MDKRYKSFGFRYTPEWVFDTTDVTVLNSFHMGCIFGILKMDVWTARQKVAELELVRAEHEIVRHLIYERNGVSMKEEEDHVSG